MASGAEYIEFLRGQRQARQFTDEPVSDADIQTILEVMRWTGSSSNTQPWQFLVLRDAEARAAIAKGTQYTGWIANSPVVIFVLTEGSDYTTHQYDQGRVDERILLASQALGLGAGIVTFWNPESQALVRSTLGLPENWSVYSAVGLGHPDPGAGPARLGGRKPLAELIHWDRFGNR